MASIKEIVKFKCKLQNTRYNSDDFKICLVDVDKKLYQDIKSNSRDEFVITGNMPDLLFNIEYEITAEIEYHKTFGVQYKVINIRIDKPSSIETSMVFLSEILTENQAKILLEVYPNIIDKVIKNDLDDVDLKKTKGIKEVTFEKIKSKIIDNFALIEIVDLFQGQISLNMVKKLYDKYSNVTTIKKKLRDNPYKSLCNISRIGFKKADEIILSIEKNDKICFKFEESNLISSKQRMKECLLYILDENESSGNTKIDIKDLRSRCNELAPQCIHHFVNVIKERENDFYVNNEDKSVSTTKAYDTEKYITDIIKEGLKNPREWVIQTELYRENNSVSLTDEQMNCLDNICKNNVSILTAPAGAGKSQAVSNVINMLKDNSKTFIMMTPTGKASDVLADYTGENVGTIHRQLKYNPIEEPNWFYNIDNKLDVDAVIIDEYSMTDIYLMKHLIDAIDITRTKILFVFDNYQLASVGCGNLAHDFLNSEVIPTTLLTKIFRYNEGGLMQVATKIRNSEKFLENDFQGVKIFGDKKDFIYNELSQEKIVNQVLNIYKKIINDGYNINDILVLSSQNKGDYGTKEINKSIQYLMQNNKENRFVMRGNDKFYLGDKVIQIVNNYKANTLEFETTSIFNGNTGIITQVNWNEIVVTFKDDKRIVYSKDELNQLELGYCISIHKSQGSQSKQVIVIAPKSHTYMLNSNLLYVAVTRAKERVYMIGNIHTINRAIKIKENFNRHTYTQNLLKEL